MINLFCKYGHRIAITLSLHAAAEAKLRVSNQSLGMSTIQHLTCKLAQCTALRTICHRDLGCKCSERSLTEAICRIRDSTTENCR